MPRPWKQPRRVPLFITCKRSGCGELRQVETVEQQVKGGYCSHRCAALDHRLGVERARKLRAAMLERLDGLTPLEAFRLGYVRGLQSKIRQIRKRYLLVKKDTAA